MTKAARLVELVDRHVGEAVTVAFGWWPPDATEAADVRMGVACMFGMLRRAVPDLVGEPSAGRLGATGAGYFVDGGQDSSRLPFFSICEDEPAEEFEVSEQGVAFSQGTIVIGVSLGTPWDARDGAQEGRA